jgi:hypothetical protein
LPTIKIEKPTYVKLNNILLVLYNLQMVNQLKLKLLWKKLYLQGMDYKLDFKEGSLLEL